MLTRREVLRLGAQAVAAGCVLRLPAIASPKAGIAYGVQMFTVRHEAAANLAGLLKTLKQIGYSVVELHPVVYPHPAAELKQMIADAGLSAPAGHFPLHEVETKLDFAQELGMKYMVSMMPRPTPVTLEDYRRAAADFERVGGFVKQHGMEFAWLFHNHEFLPQDGSTGFDEMMKHTDAATLKLEMDLYWIAQAGLDPVKLMRDHRDRLRLLHLKDRTAAPTGFDDNATAEHFTELGKGTMPWAVLLEQARRQGVPYAFMDIDKTSEPLMQSLTESLAFIKAHHL